MQQVIWRLIHPKKVQTLFAWASRPAWQQLHQLNQWSEFRVELSVWLINETGGLFWKPVWNNHFLLIFCLVTTVVQNNVHLLQNISVCKEKKKKKKKSNMCRLLGDSPLNNVLDIISHFKQITVNEPRLGIVQWLICLQSKRQFIYKQ